MLKRSFRHAGGLLIAACLAAPALGIADEAPPEETDGPPLTQAVEQGTALAPPGVNAAAFAGDGPPNCILDRGSLEAPPGAQVAEAGDGPPGVKAVEPQRAQRQRRAPLVRGNGPWVDCD